MSAHTPGPWKQIDRIVVYDGDYMTWIANVAVGGESGKAQIANARLIAAAPELLEALHEGRRAIGDHMVPDHCYATGPMTGDSYRDLVQCPACSFIAMYDAAIAKATGEQP